MSRADGGSVAKKGERSRDWCWRDSKTDAARCGGCGAPDLLRWCCGRAEFNEPGDVLEGQHREPPWFVVASPDGIGRKGICFQVGVYNRTPRSGVNESGQCSAPAVRRGIVLTTQQRNPRTGQPAITVVGGAFNKAVERVEAVSYDGDAELLHLRQPKLGGMAPGESDSSASWPWRFEGLGASSA